MAEIPKIPGSSYPYFDVVSMAGPFLLGCLLNWGLYGALSIQTFWYYLAFPRDGWAPKILVTFVYVIETAQTLIITNDCFHTFVRNFGTINDLDSMQNEWFAIPVLTAVVAFVVQLFYAYRLYILSNKKYIALCVAAPAIMQLVAGVVAGTQALRVGTFIGLESYTYISEPIWMAGNIMCDVIIVGGMAYFLLSRATASRETSILINKIVRLVIETGMLTTAISVLDCVLYFAAPTTPYHVCSTTVLSKVYSNSLLVIFNSRIRIVGGRETDRAGSRLHVSLRPCDSGAATGSSEQDGPEKLSAPGVHVQEELFICADVNHMEERVVQQAA